MHSGYGADLPARVFRLIVMAVRRVDSDPLGLKAMSRAGWQTLLRTLYLSRQMKLPSLLLPTYRCLE